MSRQAPQLVICGQVVVRFTPAGPETAQGLAIGDGRVMAIGPRHEMLSLATASTLVVDEPDRAVIPGLHDFHLHLVGMARMRRELRLDGLEASELPAAVLAAAGAPSSQPWLRGRGWSEQSMTGDVVLRLNEALAARPCLLYSHDAHSAWASPAALRMAGLEAAADPEGGRIERDASGVPTGILRERATDRVEAIAGRLRGPELDAALDEVLSELAGWGITGAVDAGDTSAGNGVGRYAPLGDRASLLMSAAARLEGRIRAWIGFPADAIDAAAGLGLASGEPVGRAGMVRAGWAKAYADGALGSRTAALFEPYTCGDAADRGIVRLEPEHLDELVGAARRARIGVAVHAIGDRAAATVLDALERAGPRGGDVPSDRIEHLQLLRPADHARLGELDVTASVQPVHCAADREAIEACWADRRALAYPWRSLARAGARLAFGSDAPIETPNPWLGVFAAVHRRSPGDSSPDWEVAEALEATSALAAYTSASAAARGRRDEGHLEPGAHADLALLNVDLPTLLSGDDRLAGVSSLLTLVAGREVHRS